MSDHPRESPATALSDHLREPTTADKSTEDRAPARHVRLQARRGWSIGSYRELWTYRELFFLLAWRDVKVRYKQTILGAAWSLLQPIFTMVVFAIVFGRLARLPSEGVPYPLFVFAALLPWQLFSATLTRSSSSLVSQQNLVKKVYFPRVILPLSSTFSATADFTVALAALAALLAWHGFPLPLESLCLPVLTLLALIPAAGAGLWLAALTAHYRDFRHTLPFISQAWFFITPIAYSASLIPDEYRVVYSLNPMVGVVESFRWALCGAPPPSAMSITCSILISTLLLCSGFLVFHRLERSLADVI